MIWSSHEAFNMSDCVDTLSVTANRQYVKGNLTYITDNWFKFFLALEQKRIALLNNTRLNDLQENLIDDCIKEVCSDGELFCKWAYAVDDEGDLDDVTLIKTVFVEAVKRYMKMGAGQFLRDFRKETKLKKTEAHRKKIQMKAAKKVETESKVTIESISKDTSPGKVNSHTRMKAMIVSNPGILNSRVYLKSELQLLCKVYSVPFKSSYNKESLSASFANQIERIHLMPKPNELDGMQGSQFAGTAGNKESIL